MLANSNPAQSILLGGATSSQPIITSMLYGKNILNFLQLIIDKEGNINLNWDDDLVKGSCITHGGEVVHVRVKQIENLKM